VSLFAFMLSIFNATTKAIRQSPSWNKAPALESLYNYHTDVKGSVNYKLRGKVRSFYYCYYDSMLMHINGGI
jgi:hypothetical protein